MADPNIRRTTIVLADMPKDASPISVLFLADIHVAGPDMPPARVARIVEQANTLAPDIILIAGDFISDKRTATRHYTAQEAVAPLGKLNAPLGMIAVPGNHDHWHDMAGIRSALIEHGFVVLANQAIQVGPLAIGGLDDDFTGRADLPATLASLEELEGGKLMLSHSPDPFPDTPRSIGLFLAGHTHCGQLRYPWGGSPATMSRYGEKYACGTIAEQGKVLITTAGIGTSVLPFRFLTQPEMWLIEIRPPKP